MNKVTSKITEKSIIIVIHRVQIEQYEVCPTDKRSAFKRATSYYFKYNLISQVRYYILNANRL